MNAESGKILNESKAILTGMDFVKPIKTSHLQKLVYSWLPQV